jgi:signal transduction histidine kinase
MGFPIYFGLGQAYYMGLRDFQLSESYFQLAERHYQDRSLNEKFVYCNNRGNSYYYQQKYDKALLWFLKAKKLVSSDKHPFELNLCYGNLSDIYLKLNQLDSSQFYLDKSCAFFSTMKGSTIDYYLITIKAGLALRRGNTNEALKLLQSDKQTQNIEPEIASIRNQCWQEYFVKIGDYKNAYKYQVLNQHLNDSIRNEKVETRIAEIDTRYKQDTAIIKRELLLNSQNNQISTLRLANYIWVLLIVIVVASSLFLYFMMKRKRDIQRMKHQEQTAQLRLQNIRNRISPHLIFNVLNQQINTEADKEQYKNLYALVKLLRKSLEFTEQTLVSLADELDFVHAYIDLEKRKIGDDFYFTQEIDPGVDTNKIHVPAMIIQIPVENALKHALRNKTGKKTLTISITAKQQGVHISIVDNGNGYNPTMKNNTDGTGTGLKVLYQTIQLLNLKNKSQITFSIANIEDKKTTGTKVEIYIPDNYHI